ncbi:MAG: NAD(P)/FAD-dependent oxidoreductase [Eubacteriales bacterium]|nr:NAD(P)/FAD-dependent oxidoreductase [Eubacteriales bacterium]
MQSVLVIGGGAAGLMAAVTAAEQGAAVTLLERNEKLGKKLYITGKGRCNCTNLCSPDDFRQNVVRNPRFLYSALEALPPTALVQKLESWGCPTITEHGRRVFPASQKASDVTRALERQLTQLGVRLRLNTRVAGLTVADGRARGVTLETGEVISADAVIVCTGGCSYPSTGSTGDGYTLLTAAGHTIVPPKPALVPLTSEAAWVRALQGLSLKNVRLTLWHGKKRLYTEIGEMLFTHFGVSGPLVLSASSYLAGLSLTECRLELDLKPGLTESQVNERLIRDISGAGRKHTQAILRGLYPERLAQVMAELTAVDPLTPASELRREQREALAHAAKALEIPVSGTEPLEAAVVTAGGAQVSQFHPATMESKLVPGLYAAGEVLDVDALTGGYNLHIAFATGYCAGRAGGVAI